jgi:DNA polymerase-1
MKKIYLVDVSSMFFRAFYAIRPLTSPAGVPVNAVYGFLSMITKLMKDERPEYMVFCYDRKDPSFRKELYEDYKANRSEMPDDLAQQIPYIKKLADVLGIPSLEVPQYEADDLIGTVAKLACRQGLQAVIVSGDKDFAQLIEDRVILYDTMKDIRYDTAKAQEKWGVRPAQFIDYLAIVGDASDNVPGVKGIGEKGAVKLLEQFPSLEEIYANIDKIESKSIRQKLLDSKEQAFLSQKLVTIVTEVPVPSEMSNYHLKPFHKDELRALLQELNFKNFEKTLLGEGSMAAPVAVTSSETAVSSTSVGSSGGDKAVSTDSSSETGGVTVNSPALAVAFSEKTLGLGHVQTWLKAGDKLWGFYDERGLYLSKDSEVIAVDGNLDELGVLTDSLGILWQGFDLKSFWHRIAAKKPQALWDSQLAAYVLKAGDTSSFAKIYHRETGDVLPEFASPSVLAQAHLKLQSDLQAKMQERHCEKIYEDFDLPLAEVLLGMENRGIRVDKPLLQQQSLQLEKDVKQLEKQIHELAGESFNVASPKQLGVILFEKLGLEAGKKTKTGYSTDIDVLEKLIHPIAPLILQYRELAKLKSTYVDVLPQMADADDRVHTSFQQAYTATGRLSSTQPNLQNIPIRTERGQEVRRAFIAAPGKKLLSVDYSQIELRILAHISEDPNLCKAFAEDLDIHAATAAEIYNIPVQEVTADLRRTAKAVNFGIAYGQGAFGLAETLGIPRKEAQEIIKRYFERFKNVNAYIESTIKTAHEKGYVETLFGRRRYIDELQSKNVALKKFGERAAINAPIQGTASDLVKKAMIDIHREIPVPMLLQVHDELIFEESEEVLQRYQSRLVAIMESVANLRVPLKVNYAIGDNWDQAH